LLMIQFTETVTLGGAIIAAMLAFAGLMTYAYGVRWKAAYQVAEANAAAWEDSAHRLNQEVVALREEVAVLKAKVDELQQHDMEAVLDVMARHERQAAERFERTISVLGEIRDNLG